MRGAHLAAHLAIYYSSFVYDEDDTTPNDQSSARLDQSISWFQTSITLRERVLREMKESCFSRATIEGFSSLCQGHADDAHQYRGVFEALLCKSKFIKGGEKEKLVQLATELVFADRQQQRAWSVARHFRGPSEKLPNMFGTSLPLLVIGDVMTASFRSLYWKDNRNKGPEIRHQLRTSLDSTWSIFLDEHAAIAEAHARFESAFHYDALDPSDAIFKLGIALCG